MKELAVKKFTQRLVDTVVAFERNGQYDRAIKAASVYDQFQYEYNDCYVNEPLEDVLRRIRSTLPKVSLTKDDTDKNTVLFYYGGYAIARGLALSYLNALSRLDYSIILATRDISDAAKNAVDAAVNGIPVTWVDLSSYKEPMAFCEALTAVFETYRPACAIAFTQHDPAGMIAFERFEGIVKRYIINQIDHAFWLGKYAFDCCIEFRDYGANISRTYRGIPADQLAILPCFPYVNDRIPFAGYPFPFHEQEQKLIFSGGSLYKTLGGDGRYYEMVARILDLDPSVVFWYAGSGDRTQMDELIRRYPNRVFLTAERPDFLQIMKRCVFYLSTYPLAGGLMYQYAAISKKVCLTLDFKKEESVRGLLRNEEALRIHFDEMEALLAEADRLLSDAQYRSQREAVMSTAVISPEEFAEQLKLLLETGKTDYPVQLHQVNTTEFLKLYADRITYRYLCMSVAKPRMPWLIRYFPKEYLLGTIWKLPAWMNVLWGRRKGMHHGKNKS